jgi:THAP4-like, heme-binding beta-barrel domain
VSELVAGPLPSALEPLAFLLGTWRGSGTGGYPAIDPFAYEEELRFEHVGDTFLLYAQRSWSPTDGAPIHFERGFLRRGERDLLELTLAHPLGLTEVSEGPLEGTSLALTSSAIGRTSTGMDVVAVARRYEVRGDVLAYGTDMATERTEMTLHLQAQLRRVAP